VVVSTAACGGRLGGSPAHDGVLYLPRPRPRIDRGDAITPYHVTPTYSTRKRRAPSGVALRAHLPEPDSVEASGAHFPIKTGAQFPIRNTIATKQKIQNQLSRGTSSHDVNGGIKVHPAEARAGVEKSGHADLNWSCVIVFQIGRSACPPACCITLSASAATSTPAPTIRAAK